MAFLLDMDSVSRCMKRWQGLQLWFIMMQVGFGLKMIMGDGNLSIRSLALLTLYSRLGESGFIEKIAKAELQLETLIFAQLWKIKLSDASSSIPTATAST